LIAVDTNLLVYSARRDMPLHAAAAACIAGLVQSGQPWCIPWPCVHEFISVATNRRLFEVPMPLEVAFDAIDAWRATPHFAFIGEAPGHLARLRDTALTGRISGALIHDARIAAICIDHGVHELWSADRDFGRFPALKVMNPLVRV